MEKNKSSKQRWLKWLFKIVVSTAAIIIVSYKIDFRQVFTLYASISVGFIFLAILFFNFSKIASAFRYKEFITKCGINLNSRENLRLYYVGMFYNLFLPGGVGGDGYKIYLLQKGSSASWKKLAIATILDRVNGLAALGSLFLILFCLQYFGFTVWSFGLLLFAACIPVLGYLIGMKIFFSSFNAKNKETLGISFLVQGLQLICALFILFSLGQYSLINEYLLIFLASSIVAVLPLTIGGIGARELVFIYFGEWLGINIDQAVAFSLLFFLITALSSLAGIFFEVKPQSAINHAESSK